MTPVPAPSCCFANSACVASMRRYMLVILTDKGVPSPAKILSVLPDNATMAE